MHMAFLADRARLHQKPQARNANHRQRRLPKIRPGPKIMPAREIKAARKFKFVREFNPAPEFNPALAHLAPPSAAAPRTGFAQDISGSTRPMLPQSRF
jgi:hypothetical protein